MPVYTPDRLTPTLLTTAIASYKSFDDTMRMHLCRIANLSANRARVWVWLSPDATTPSGYTMDLRQDGSQGHVHGANDAITLFDGEYLFRGYPMNLADPPLWIPDDYQLWGMTDYSDYGTENAAVLTTAEVIKAANATITYAATTLTDSAAPFVASPANGDFVGRRIEAGGAYLIVTTSTTTVLTGSDGWREKTTGKAYLNPANGNLFPTSGGAGDGYTTLASMRDTRELTLAKDSYPGQLLTTGAYNGRREARCVGNNAGIATYGTTFQILNGGWPTGLPTAGKDWTIASLVSLAADWTQRV